MPTLGELAVRLGAECRGDAGLRIESVAAIEDAQPGQITFVTDPKHLVRLKDSAAGAVLLGPGQDACGKPALVHPAPGTLVPRLLAEFAPEAPAVAAGIAPTASVAASAKVAPTAKIGPGAVIETDVEIADGAEIGPLCWVGWGSRIGRDARLVALVAVGPRTVLGERVLIHPGAVLGADGFGFLPGGDLAVKIPQIGRVVIEDDVEIGAGTTIDRATVGETRIKRGAKLDDQVHVGHNVVIGEKTMVAGQAGFGGSTVVGRGAMIGGQAGIADHVTLGDGAQIGAQSGVFRDAPAGSRWFGFPAQPAVESMRRAAEIARLPKVNSKLRELERRVAELEKKLGTQA